MNRFLPLLLLFSPLQAVTYVEDVDGEFSAEQLTPTLIVLESGSNSISGNIGVNAGILDLDYFSILVPEGQQLGSIFLLGYFNQADDGGVSFWALDDGPTFSVAPTDADAAATGFLGWAHLTNAAPDANLLTDFSTTPLPSGTYTLWLQETGAGRVDYGLEFNLTTVPEPSSLWMLMLGMGALVRRTRSIRAMDKMKGDDIERDSKAY